MEWATFRDTGHCFEQPQPDLRAVSVAQISAMPRTEGTCSSAPSAGERHKGAVIAPLGWLLSKVLDERLGLEVAQTEVGALEAPEAMNCRKDSRDISLGTKDPQVYSAYSEES